MLALALDACECYSTLQSKGVSVKLLIVVGSTRPGRIGLKVTDWFHGVAQDHGGFEVENHGYPAPLKNAIDLLSHEWRRKPVAFVGYGGIAAGSRAVEQ